MTETRLREAFPAGTESGGLAIKETRSAEKALCSISEAGNRMGVRSADSCPKADSPPESQRARAFLGEGRGRPAETAQSARGRLEMGQRWSDQRHLNQVQLVFGSSAGVAPFLSGQLWELWQLMLQLQSAHQVVSLSIWGGGVQCP